MLIRAVHDKNNPYFQMRRATAQDDRLTWNARGVMAYLFSKPDTWTLSLADLLKQTTNSRNPLGRDGVRAVLAELETLGYLHRFQERNQNGVLGDWVSHIYETPRPVTPNPSPVADKPEPVTAQPATAQPATANPPLDTTDSEKVQIAESTEAAAAERGIAAAAAKIETEPHDSRHSFSEIEQFVRATKPHSQNPGGLARTLYRSGEEDSLISGWLDTEKTGPAHQPTNTRTKEEIEEVLKKIEAYRQSALPDYLQMETARQ